MEEYNLSPNVDRDYIEVNLDLHDKTSTSDVQNYYVLKQGDHISRVLRCNLTKGGLIPIDLKNSVLTLYIKKADMGLVAIKGTIVDATNGIVDFPLTRQSLAIADKIICEVVKIGSDASTMSFPLFSLQVEDTIIDEELVESTDEFSLLTDALGQVAEWEGKFETKYNSLENSYAKELTSIKTGLEETNEQLLQDKKELSNKIQEVASTGTTIEAVQSKVEEMAQQGLIQAYTLGDGTVTNEKLSNEISIHKIKYTEGAKLTIDNFTTTGATEIAGGVNVSQSSGSTITISIDTTSFSDGVYELLFNYKSGSDISAMAGYFKIFTSTISEENIVFSPTTDIKIFSKTFEKTSNTTKVQYVISATGLSNVNLDFTNIIIKKTNPRTLTEKLDTLENSLDELKEVKWSQKLTTDNFKSNSTISVIENGVNLTSEQGGYIEITVDTTNLTIGKTYVISFDHKSNGSQGDYAGVIKEYTSSIRETSKVFSNYTSEQHWSYSFVMYDGLTKIVYSITNSGTTNINIDFTDPIIYSTTQTTLFLQELFTKTEKCVNELSVVKEVFSNEVIIFNNVLEVSSSYDASTSGFGVSKFNSLITAHEYTNGKSSIDNRYLIKVYPGTYTDWQTVYAGSDDETDSSYLGIRVNDYVYFESTDVNHPENYILEWDGHSGFSDGYTMNSTQAMRRCLFHLDKRPLHTHIKGFTLKAKNTRYCIHPETAGTGWGNEWLIENCIFDWGGCPNVTGYSGATVGIGISSGEKGHIKNCKWKNSGYAGIVGHNNGFAENQWNANKPFFVEGANLLVENCDLNNCSITQDTLKDDIDGFDLLTIKNCRNVKSVSTGLQGTASKQNWKVEIVQSEIIDS